MRFSSVLPCRSRDSAADNVTNSCWVRMRLETGCARYCSGDSVIPQRINQLSRETARGTARHETPAAGRVEQSSPAALRSAIPDEGAPVTYSARQKQSSAPGSPTSQIWMTKARSSGFHAGTPRQSRPPPDFGELVEGVPSVDSFTSMSFSRSFTVLRCRMGRDPLEGEVPVLALRHAAPCCG